MAKELYLYSNIYDFVAEKIISQMEECKDMDVCMRIYSMGGDVFAGWGIIAKMKEMPNGVSVKVDGMAASMAAYICMYASKVECIDTSTFLLHRASGYVASPEDQAFLDQVNNDLRSKLEKKIDGKKLKELKGISIKNLFEDETRIDLVLTAKEAKAVGLVDKINPVNPQEVKAFNDRIYGIAAISQPVITKPKTKTTMTIETLKAEHPEVFAEAVALGAYQERERVEAFMVYNELDPKAVKAGIESGKPLTQKQMAEFGLKSLSAEALAKIAKGAADTVNTEEVDPAKAAAETEVSEFEKQVKASLKLK